MPVIVTCAGCGKRYRMPDHARGREFPCKECGYPMRIPRGDGAGTAAPPPARRGAASAAKGKRSRHRRNGFDYSFRGPLNKVYAIGAMVVATYVALLIVGMAPGTLPQFLFLGGILCCIGGLIWGMEIIRRETDVIYIANPPTMLLLILFHLHCTWPGLLLILGGVGLIVLSRPDQWF